MTAPLAGGRTLTPALLETELRRLEPIAAGLARRYMVPGHDRDDVRQIARVGLWQALERWDGTSPLEAFAHLVAERRVQDALTRARRRRRFTEERPLSLSGTTLDEHGVRIEIEVAAGDIAELAELRDELRTVVAALPSLSPLERRALAVVIRGDHGTRSACSGAKWADNGFQRARRKLRAAVDPPIAA